MTQSYEQLAFTFPWYLRLTLSLVGAGLIILLITAALLTPDPEGYGTHQQLDLPPCSFLVMSGGTPCPSCGMTTSWSHLVRLQVWKSIKANAGGTMLALVAVVLGPWLLISGLIGNWYRNPPNEKMVIVTAVAIIVVTLVSWLVRIL